MMALNESILLNIECPACMEYMEAPIYVCVTGHSICNKCWKGLDICPSCNKELSGTRNYTVETLASLLYYPCNNVERGCKENLRLPEIEEHLLVCSTEGGQSTMESMGDNLLTSYRNYKCKIEKCNWEGTRNCIEEHFLNFHGDSVIVGPEVLSWWKNAKRSIRLLLAHKEVFYVHMKLVKNYMYWVVQYIGKSEDIIQYYFQIHLFSDQFEHRKIRIFENCQDDIKDDITEIIESGYAVGIPLPVLETYRNENGHVWFKIIIHKT